MKFGKFHDNDVNETLINEGWIIIRIGYSLCDIKNKFDTKLICDIIKIIEKKDIGLFKFGNEYGEN